MGIRVGCGRDDYGDPRAGRVRRKDRTLLGSDDAEGVPGEQVPRRRLMLHDGGIDHEVVAPRVLTTAGLCPGPSRRWVGCGAGVSQGRGRACRGLTVCTPPPGAEMVLGADTIVLQKMDGSSAQPQDAGWMPGGSSTTLENGRHAVLTGVCLDRPGHRSPGLLCGPGPGDRRGPIGADRPNLPSTSPPETGPERPGGTTSLNV